MEKDSDFQPPKKKQRKGDLLPGKRFVSPVSDDQMAVISKGFIPHKNTNWAMSCFREWRSARDRKSAERKTSVERIFRRILISKNWITGFVAEVRNKILPLRTILAGLQRYKLSKNPNAPKFGETCFSEICGTCDTVYRDLCSKGIGAEVCHTLVNYHTRRRG